jgi:uncharacterized repeat protein (TIGR03803 family)
MHPHLRSRHASSALATATAIAVTMFGAAPAHAEYDRVHIFNRYTGESYPTAGLTLGVDGNFYGVTTDGGPAGAGTLFRVTPQGRYTTLHGFSGQDGGPSTPQTALVSGPDGRLYGASRYGGPSGEGTLFAATLDGQVTVLYAFGLGGDCSHGCQPVGGVAMAPDGTIFGATPYGGTINRGVVFRFDTDGTQRVLWDLRLNDPQRIESALVVARDGLVWGTSIGGGDTSANSDGYGTVFRLAPDGSSHRVVHAFSAPGLIYPFGSLTQARDGRFFGTTERGGGAGCSTGCGGVFSLSASGDYAEVAHFDDFDHGPMITDTGLVEGPEDHVFYGSSNGGGAYYWGTIYRVRAWDGHVQVLHDFGRARTDGESPRAPLMLAPDGSFYGTTYLGGQHKSGTIFHWAPPPEAPR